MSKQIQNITNHLQLPIHAAGGETQGLHATHKLYQIDQIKEESCLLKKKKKKLKRCHLLYTVTKLLCAIWSPAFHISTYLLFLDDKKCWQKSDTIIVCIN